MIRALAIDIDGTITDKSRRINLDAIQKLRDLEKSGIPIILASGNNLCFMDTACLMIGTSGPLIAENGGIVECGDDVYYLGDPKRVNHAFDILSSKYELKKVKRSHLRITEIAVYRDIDVEILEKEVDPDWGVDIVDSNFAIHIKDERVNKGEALKFVSELIDVKPENIAAIGDSENDYEMIKYAGVGISIRDENMRGFCDYVTEKPFGEGALEAIEYLTENGYLKT